MSLFMAVCMLSIVLCQCSWLYAVHCCIPLSQVCMLFVVVCHCLRSVCCPLLYALSQVCMLSVVVCHCLRSLCCLLLYATVSGLYAVRCCMPLSQVCMLSVVVYHCLRSVCCPLLYTPRRDQWKSLSLPDVWKGHDEKVKVNPSHTEMVSHTGGYWRGSET